MNQLLGKSNLGENRKGMQLAISTLILIIIGVAVLIGMILFLTGSFERFKDTTDPLSESASYGAVREACRLFCLQEDKFNYCCKEFEVDKISLKCEDSRLDISCELDCGEFVC